MKTEKQLPATAQEFRANYWLKEELLAFCKQMSLPRSGSKEDLIDYISCFLEDKPIQKKNLTKLKSDKKILDPDMLIVENYSNDENHRKFFIKEIGQHFKFNVTFMNWMKENSGVKTYNEAIAIWKSIEADKKSGKKIEIGKQFEYNQYTRDFFADNPSLTRADCILCWNYKKEVPNNHCYQKEDLMVLK